MVRMIVMKTGRLFGCFFGLVLLTPIVWAASIATGSGGANLLYDEGLRSFSTTNTSLLVGHKLLPLLQSKIDASYFIVTPRTWASNKSILRVSVKNGVCSAERINAKGERKPLDYQGIDLYLDDVGYFSYNEKCYLFLNGQNNHINHKAHLVNGVPVWRYIYGSLDDAIRELKLETPSYTYVVSFRFCNGKELIRLGSYAPNDVIDEFTIRKKIKPIMQNAQMWLGGCGTAIN